MTLTVPPVMMILPLESMPSVSPDPIVTVTVPPVISTVGVCTEDLRAALIPSSVAWIVMSPPLIRIYVASIPSRAVRSSVPPAISAFSFAWTASSPLRIEKSPPPMRREPSVWRPSSRELILQLPPLIVREAPAFIP